MIEIEQVIASHGDGDLTRYVAIADYFLLREDRAAAAVALDRAFGLAPRNADIARHRAAILDELAVREHGLVWRYVPAGTFLMGSLTGDPDERPVHARTVAAFWITEVPISWASYCDLLGWTPPPDARPPELDAMDPDAGYRYWQRHQIRSRYCASRTEPRATRHAVMPMVGVGTGEAEQLADHLTGRGPGRYRLPTEAQWEKAARGGLVGARYAWGDDPPIRATCDFERMGDFQLLDPRSLPANGYGIHGMCGGVAEWTADVYDALAYHLAAAGELSASPDAPQRVLRGGGWTDCADAVTVSYRTSRDEQRAASPTIGFRLVRTV